MSKENGTASATVAATSIVSSTQSKYKQSKLKSEGFIDLADKAERIVSLNGKIFFYVAIGEKLLGFEQKKSAENSLEYTHLRELTIDDHIKTFHVIDEKLTVIIGKEKKFLFLFEGDNLVEKVEHQKKITDSFIFKYNNLSYLTFSDKFGEINLKVISEFKEDSMTLYGHSDSVLYVRPSPDFSKIASVDNFGKLKICEYPNIFNVLTVICYRTNEVIYMDFINNEYLLVVTNELVAHFWCLKSFSLARKHNLNSVASEVKSIYSHGETLVIESSKSLEIVHCENILEVKLETRDLDTTEKTFIYKSSETKSLRRLTYDSNASSIKDEAL